MKLLSTFLILFFTCNSFAYEVKYLNKDDKAPFTGYLITPEMEKDLRYLDKELEYQKALNLSLTNINKTYEDNTVTMQSRITNQQKQIDNLTDKLGSDNSVWGKIGMFLLGAATATAITYGVAQVVK